MKSRQRTHHEKCASIKFDGEPCDCSDAATKASTKASKRLQAVDDSWTRGFALALAEIHRLGGHSSNVRDVARDAGVTIKSARKVGVDAYDWSELKKAGVALE
jgi:hypothetical protein